MEYDFDMERLLETFDGDAEKLANAFADELNKALATHRHMEAINNASQDVADAWNNFVDTYFGVYDVPSGFAVEDFMLAHENDNTAISLLEFLVKCGPVLVKYGHLFEQIEKVNTTADDINPPPRKEQSFDESMKEFFKKMGW